MSGDKSMSQQFLNQNKDNSQGKLRRRVAVPDKYDATNTAVLTNSSSTLISNKLKTNDELLYDDDIKEKLSQYDFTKYSFCNMKICFKSNAIIDNIIFIFICIFNSITSSLFFIISLIFFGGTNIPFSKKLLYKL